MVRSFYTQWRLAYAHTQCYHLLAHKHTRTLTRTYLLQWYKLTQVILVGERERLRRIHKHRQRCWRVWYALTERLCALRVMCDERVAMRQRRMRVELLHYWHGVYVCVCVCMYVCMCVFMYVCVCVCAFLFCVWECNFFTHTHIHTYTHTHTYTYTHTHTTHTHTHIIHTHTQIELLSLIHSRIASLCVCDVCV